MLYPKHKKYTDPRQRGGRFSPSGVPRAVGGTDGGDVRKWKRDRGAVPWKTNRFGACVRSEYRLQAVRVDPPEVGTPKGGQEHKGSSAWSAGADGAATKSAASQTASALTGLAIVRYCKATTATSSSSIRTRVRRDTLDMVSSPCRIRCSVFAAASEGRNTSNLRLETCDFLLKHPFRVTATGQGIGRAADIFLPSGETTGCAASDTLQGSVSPQTLLCPMSRAIHF